MLGIVGSNLGQTSSAHNIYMLGTGIRSIPMHYDYWTKKMHNGFTTAFHDGILDCFSRYYSLKSYKVLKTNACVVSFVMGSEKQ